MERGLFVSTASWPEADDPSARLGRAADLEAILEPSAALDLVPRHILQQTAPEPASVRMRRRAGGALATFVIHVGFAAAFVAFLTWRPVPPADDGEVPVEILVEPPPPKPQAARPPDAPKLEPPKPEPTKPAPSKSLADLIPQPPPAPAPDPNPPAPPVVQPPPSAPAQPALLAPPPEPTRAKTQTQEKTPPNLEPDAAEAPKATHEAKPLDAPKVLATADPKASFAVPKPAVPKPQTADPAPAAPRAPTETEKLAAALPMDTTALPDTFRAVLSGNGAAVDAAYKGLVFGQFGRSAASISERARQQHLKGQVIVAFTIDDEGGIKSLVVFQSSGNPAVDALGIEMIRSAAPFPAPPPGAPRSFTPALAFGQ